MVCLRKGRNKHKRNYEIQPMGEQKNLPPVFVLNKVGFLIKRSKSKVTDSAFTNVTVQDKPDKTIRFT